MLTIIFMVFCICFALNGAPFCTKQSRKETINSFRVIGKQNDHVCEKKC